MFFPRLSLALIAALSLWSATSADASLQFEKEMIFATAVPGSGPVSGRFAFTNKGNYPVTIESLKTSCGCTAATSEKKLIEPGGKGEVLVTYNTAGRRGLKEAPVIIKTDDPSAPESVVRFRVLIQEVIELQPTLLFWKADEPLTAKTLTVKVTEGFPVKALTARASDASLKVQVESVKAGSEYVIRVSPPSDARSLKATIEIVPDYPAEKAKVMIAHIRVR